MRYYLGGALLSTSEWAELSSTTIVWCVLMNVSDAIVVDGKCLPHSDFTTNLATIKFLYKGHLIRADRVSVVLYSNRKRMLASVLPEPLTPAPPHTSNL